MKQEILTFAQIHISLYGEVCEDKEITAAVTQLFCCDVKVLIILRKNEMILNIRRHSTTTWTDFLPFFDLPNARGQFLYSERGQK